MMSTVSLDTATPRRIGLLRAGLILAVVLAALDVITGVLALSSGFFAPPEVGVVIVALGVATLVLVPFAWRGRRAPAWSAVVLRLLSSAAGLPAFFVTDVPPEAIVAAAIGILLAVVSAVLVAFGIRGGRK